MKTKTTTQYLPEIWDRAVRILREHQGECASQWAAIQSIAAKIGCTSETLRRCLRQSERDSGERVVINSADL